MKPSRLMFAAACIAMLVATSHAQPQPAPYSANEVMQGCRAIMGAAAWFEEVRTLAPDARIPYIVTVMAEAFEAGLTPQQFVAALANPHPDSNWVMCLKPKHLGALNS